MLNRSNKSQISIETTTSRWFYYKILLWNFKYYHVQIKKVSYWLTSKQSVSNHVSLCQDMRFLLAFPWQLVNLKCSTKFNLRPGNDKQISVVCKYVCRDNGKITHVKIIFQQRCRNVNFEKMDTAYSVVLHRKE